MALKYWVGGIVGVGAIAAVGGNLYADSQIQQYYQQQQAENNKVFQIKQGQVKMGLFSGEADYTLSIIPGPCNPQQKFDIKVKDTIHRGIAGYNIDSKIELPAEWQKELKPIFADKPAISIESKLSWSGNVHVMMSSPAINHQKDNFYLQSKGITLEFDTHKNDFNLLKDFKLNLPSLIIRDDQNYLSLDQMSLTTDQWHAKKILENSTSNLTLNHFKLNTYISKPVDFNLQKLKLSSHGELKDQQYNVSNQFEIGKFQLPNSESTGNLAFNVDVKALDAVKLQALMDELDRAGQECSANATEDKVTQAILALLEQGIKLESTKNIVQLGDTSLKAEFKGELPKGQYANLESFMSAVPLSLQYSGQVETDKAFIKEMIKSIPELSSQGDTDQIMDEMISAMKAQGAVKQNGDQLISKFEYKYGKPRFIN